MKSRSMPESTKAAVIGGITSFLLSVGTAIGVEWTPKVFGNWYSKEISKLLKEEKER